MELFNLIEELSHYVFPIGIGLGILVGFLAHDWLWSLVFRY